MTILLRKMALVITLLLTGCSQTGNNEHLVNLSDLDNTLIQQEKVLKQYINSAQHQLLSLSLETKGRCLNGQIALTNALFIRAKNEYQHALYKDAFITLTSFDRQLRKTKCILAYVEGKFGCKQTNKSNVLKSWYESGSFEQCPKLTTLSLDDKQRLNTHSEIIIETLHEFDSAKIKPIYFQSLDRVATLLALYPNSSVLIEGHADSVGSDNYNQKLGTKRAKAVGEYLHSKGVPYKAINMSSIGEGQIREIELTNTSRVFNRYTALTINLNTQNTNGDNDD